jgi:uncharacterized protein (DUF2141 family)
MEQSEIGRVSVYDGSMIGGDSPFHIRVAWARLRHRLLLAAAIVLAATAARAQEQTAVGGVFLPLPDEVPATLIEGLSKPEEDPAEIAQKIRSSISGPAVVSAPVDQVFGTSTVEPSALIGPGSSAVGQAAFALDEAGVLPAIEAPTTALISVIVENVETDGGTVNVGLCDKGLSRETCPYDREVRASAGFVEATFENIPPGSYAVVAYHDVNGNGQFDRMLGIPREPYALSGRAAKKMVPTFDDAVLPIRTGENAVVIRLKRLGGG